MRVLPARRSRSTANSSALYVIDARKMRIHRCRPVQNNAPSQICPKVSLELTQLAQALPSVASPLLSPCLWELPRFPQAGPRPEHLGHSLDGTFQEGKATSILPEHGHLGGASVSTFALLPLPGLRSCLAVSSLLQAALSRIPSPQGVLYSASGSDQPS